MTVLSFDSYVLSCVILLMIFVLKPRFVGSRE
jgi:hypothetical protein